MLNGLPSFPDKKTMVNANGHTLNGSTFAASNRANPYAHAQPGMYAGGNSLNGFGQNTWVGPDAGPVKSGSNAWQNNVTGEKINIMPSNKHVGNLGTVNYRGFAGADIRSLTVGDLLDKVPTLLKMAKSNPKAMQMLISTFGASLGMGGFGSISDSRQTLQDKHQVGIWSNPNNNGSMKDSYKLLHGRKKDADGNPLPDAVDNYNTIADFDVLHTDQDGTRPSPSMIYWATKTASKIINAAPSLEKDGVNYLNPKMKVAKVKMGRNPEYMVIHTVMTSDNHPNVEKTIRLIDANGLDDDGLIMSVSNTFGQESEKLHLLSNEVFLSYHDYEKDFLDKWYYDGKYGWAI